MTGRHLDEEKQFILAGGAQFTTVLIHIYTKEHERDGYSRDNQFDLRLIIVCWSISQQCCVMCQPLAIFILANLAVHEISRDTSTISVRLMWVARNVYRAMRIQDPAITQPRKLVIT